MNDFIQKFLDDLPQQFKERERITQFFEVIGGQFQEVADFFESLRLNRSINTASGKQLDGIGQIVVMDREEARIVFGIDRPLTDDEYRRMLVYKVMMNFGNATYSDIISCMKILKGDDIQVHYLEEPENPATFILETELKPNDPAIMTIINTPIPRAAGVGMRLRTNDGADMKLYQGIVSSIAEDKVLDVDLGELGDTWLYEDENSDVLDEENSNSLLREEAEG